MTMMDSPPPATAAEAADSQPATDGPMGLADVPCSLTVDQMATEMGLELCHFNAAKKSDCDQCCNAAIGEHIWVKMAGAYEGSSEEAEYYACSKCVTNKYDPEWRSENESSK